MDARSPPLNGNDKTPIEETRFLPAVANAIAEWFYPMLENPNGGPPRSVAVSDIDITKENIPTLPLVLVAFTQSVGHQLLRSSSSQFEVTDSFIVEFWLEPTRMKNKQTGKDTPYWNYYPYEFVRNKLIKGFLDWTGPNGEHVAYRSLHVEADPLAARLTFTFIATFQWCPANEFLGDPFQIGFRLCAPSVCCEPDCEDEAKDECDPCP